MPSIKTVLKSLLLLFPSLSMAAKNYQVDLILFTQTQSALEREHSLSTPFLPFEAKDAIKLRPLSNDAKPYHELPPSRSSLLHEYSLLHQSRSYTVLGRFSWIQPPNNQHAIELPVIHLRGWEIRGTLKIEQSHYYLFEPHLQCSPPDKPDAAFLLSQPQRLKEDQTYFFDHPELGMLVKIHQL
jgi:hypothetical protein